MPIYSVSHLTTIEDCDAVLGIADREQKNMQWKKLNLERQKDQYANSAFVVSTELSAKRSELATLDSIIANLPDGTIKTEQVKKRTAVWYRIFLLENRQSSYGEVAFLEKEFELQRVQKELDETAVLIDEVTARKAEL